MDNDVKTENVRTFSAKPLSTGVAIALTAVSAVLGGAFPAGYGGLVFLCIATGLFAYVLTVSLKPVYLIIAAAGSVGIALLCGASAVLSVWSLSYIPLAWVLSISVRRRMSISGAVIAVTAAAAAILAIAAGIYYIILGDTAVSQATGLFNQYKNAAINYLSSLTTPSPNGAIQVLSNDDITALINNIVMMLPSMLVLTLFLFSYIGVKILRIVSMVCDNNEMFEGGQWSITAGLPASVLFAVCYLATLFSGGQSIVFFSAVNLMYMLLPAMSIVGFNYMFGKKSRFRNGLNTSGKVVLIVLCILSVYLNPIMLFVLASFFTVYENIRAWRNTPHSGVGN